MHGQNFQPGLVLDAAALSLVQAQSYRINATLYETKYPDFDFARLVFVDTTGPMWSPGVMTFTSDMSGKAAWQSAAAKDIPLADVSQSMELKTFSLAAIGYQWNIEEVNTALSFVGGTLPDRRARAARKAYMQFMYNLTVAGDTEKGLKGLINYGGIAPAAVPNDGTGSARYWVNSAGVGLKTPAQIVRDINLGIMGVYQDTFETEMADTVLLPTEAMTYIAQTPYAATTMETILSFIQRTNIYTQTTGRPLTFRTIRELSTAATVATAPSAAGKGRMVVYKNDAESVKLHLPMPHQFLPVYQDGPLNFTVPGIFRTGGIEFMNTAAVRYLDGVSEPAA